MYFRLTNYKFLSKFQIQRGVATIPKSSTRSRQQENFEVFNFELTPDDVLSIDALNNNSRIFIYPQYVLQQCKKIQCQVSNIAYGFTGQPDIRRWNLWAYTDWKLVKTADVFTASSSSSSSSSSSNSSRRRRNTCGNNIVNLRSPDCWPNNHPHALSNVQKGSELCV